ncbi:MAG: N-acetylglucosamine-6-phosphate deacetylase [Planctomyces sp.]|jgi:N-acetylglucosamine-6-phosphate deacetylase
MAELVARHYRDGRAVRLRMEGGIIASVEDAGVNPESLRTLPYVAPGLFDIQLNGYAGDWFCSDDLTVEAVERIIHSYVNVGIARCFPTLITSSFESMLHGIQTIVRAAESSELVRSVVRGIHLEGPWISPEDGPRGAHPREHVRSPNAEQFDRWQEASGGLVRLVTLAPETPNAMAMIRELSSRGVVVALGHTGASPECLHEAAASGARMTTHLGNGCSSTINRHQNVFWPQLADDRLTASIISDGWHVPADLMNCILRCKGAERVIITSDISGFGGCEPGTYSAGGVSVEVLEDRRIVVAGQRQYLAGSASTTGDCVLQMMSACQMNLADAWDLASERPTAMFGLPSCALQKGCEATLTLFRIEEQDGKDRITGNPGSSVEPPVSTFIPLATVVQGRLVRGQLSTLSEF